MEKTRRGPAAATGALILLAVAALLVLPSLERQLGLSLGGAARRIQAGFAERGGLRVSFASLSPSVLKGLSLGRLELRDQGGRLLLVAQRAFLRYDLLALLGGRSASVIKELRLEEGRILVDPASLSLIRSLVGGKGAASGPPVLPAFPISGEGMTVAIEGFSDMPLNFDVRSFSLGGAGEESELSLSGSMDSGDLPAVGKTHADFSATGTLSRDLSMARLRLSLAMESAVLAFGTQRFEFAWSEGRAGLRKIEDSAPIDALLSYDSSTSLLKGQLRMEGFVPAPSLQARGSFSYLKPWLDVPYSGNFEFEVPVKAAGGTSYALDLKGSLPRTIFSNAYALELRASGGLEGVDVARAIVQGPFGSLSYQGKLRFRGFHTEGEFETRLGLRGGRLPVESRLSLSGGDGHYLLRTSTLQAAGLDLPGLGADLRLSGSILRFEAGFDPEAAGMPPALTCSGSLDLGEGGAFTAELGVDRLELGRLEPVIAAASSPVLASILKRLTLSGEMGCRGDLRHFSLTAKGVEISESGRPANHARISLHGDESSLVLDGAEIAYSGITASASGKLSFAAKHPGGGPGGLGFSFHLGIGGESYALEGSYGGNGLFARGDHGLEVAATSVDGETYLSLRAESLPLPVAGKVLSLGMVADGRWLDAGDWNLALASFDLRAPGEGGRPGASLSCSGRFGPGSGDLLDIVYEDGLPRLSGQAHVDYGTSGSGTSVRLSSRLAAPTGQESYLLVGELGSSGLSATLDLAGLPLARSEGLPATGNVDGRVSVSGQLDDPHVAASLRLGGGKLLGQDLAASAAGSWEKGVIVLDSASLSLSSLRVVGLQGHMDVAGGGASLKGSFSWAQASGEPLLGGDFEAAGAALAGGAGDASYPSFLPFAKGYAIQGKAVALRFKGGRLADWPFEIGLGPDGPRFTGGQAREVAASWKADGSFSLATATPFPFAVGLEGQVASGRVEAMATVSGIDLSLLFAFFGNLPVAVDKGSLSGSLRIQGEAANPEMSGALAVEGLVCRVPGWLRSSLGPFSTTLEADGHSLALSAASVPCGDARLDLEAGAVLAAWLPSDISGHVRTVPGSALAVKAQVLGVKADGLAQADLDFTVAAGTLGISGSLVVQKCVASINPAGFMKRPSAGPSPLFYDVDLSIGFGPGVRVYFPSPELPVVMGNADPSSALTIKYSQESGELTFKGTTVLRAGEVFYIQRDFFLKSAKIVFNETADHFDPLVTLYAERRVRTDKGPVLIRLSADSVPLFDLRPRLSSDPPMGEGQIATLLGANLLGASEGEDFSLKKAVIAGSELVPGLDVATVFEEKVREALGLDIFFVQTQLVQRWVMDLAGLGTDRSQGSLASYLDDSTIYAGKYIGDNIFLHASAFFQKDPLVPSGPLRLDSEFGIELEAPFGLLSWSVAPKTPQSLFISDQSLSLSWKLRL
jgi:hypothetical protein